MSDEVYRNARERLAELAGALGPEQLRIPVPATPRWTVHELIAHLVGGAADVATGRLDGVPSEAWTTRHVGERRDHPINELLAEWDVVGPRVESNLDRKTRSPSLSFDIVCHEGDLHESLGLAPTPREHWQSTLDVMVPLIGRRLRQPGLLVIRDEQGQQWDFGEGEPQTLLVVEGYELLRGTFSRRSQRQIASWAWTKAPPERLRRFGLFGPREDDQPIPHR
jgi:uncharacterized protein (TIGR03083 family)